MKNSKKWIVGVLLCGLILGVSGCGTTEVVGNADAADISGVTDTKKDETLGLKDEEIDKIFEDIENAGEMTQEEFDLVLPTLGPAQAREAFLTRQKSEQKKRGTGPALECKN